MATLLISTVQAIVDDVKLEKLFKNNGMSWKR
jgi:hypothetical protein